MTGRYRDCRYTLSTSTFAHAEQMKALNFFYSNATLFCRFWRKWPQASKENKRLILNNEYIFVYFVATEQ